MPHARDLPGLLLSLALAGCAAAPPPRPAPLAADLSAWTSAPPEAPPASRALLHAADATSAPAARTLARAPATEARPPRRGHVDVSFYQADMVSAFQFLADAGRFNVVLSDGLGGKVSATLRGVDPYDALVSLAAAHGANVRYDRDIVVVAKR